MEIYCCEVLVFYLLITDKLYKDTQVETKSVEKDTLCKQHRKAEVAVLTSNKIDFKTRNIIRNKEGHFR